LLGRLDDGVELMASSHCELGHDVFATAGPRGFRRDGVSVALLGARGLDGETALYACASRKQDRDGVAAIGFGGKEHDAGASSWFTGIDREPAWPERHGAVVRESERQLSKAVANDRPGDLEAEGHGFSRARDDTAGAERFASILGPATAGFNCRGGLRLRGGCARDWILDMPRNDAGHDFQGRHANHIVGARIDAWTSAGLELAGALKRHRHEAELVLLGCGLADQRRRSSNVA
jgi:hypothetical protein